MVIPKQTMLPEYWFFISGNYFPLENRNIQMKGNTLSRHN